ncbi:uncharacterized protein [Chelonus insularis]|uniref:uncharacterized protein n=1 Tax=Chelonus insularis TaxID=460826 RepID=UPI00158E16D7|nr:uncharacterized protein LOC118064787 [Chelonus insularis]
MYNFEKDLRNEVITDRFKSIKMIYNELSLKYPEVVMIKTWLEMEPRMRKWREEVQPPIPLMLEEYQMILDDPQWAFLFSNNGDINKMHVSTIKSTDGSCITIYGNVELLKLINPLHLMMDATFSVVPRKPKAHQLFTILAIAIPILWSLMEKKTASAYTKLLNYFSTILSPQIQPTFITSDFEVALALAIHSNFPEATHSRCFFHYTQAITKRLKKLRLLPFLQQCRMARVIMKKSIALPLLPPEDMREAYDWLLQNIPECMKSIFHKFLTYYDRQWVQLTRAECLSVFKMVHRTNNFSEAYNRLLTLLFGEHPSIWKFTANKKEGDVNGTEDDEDASSLKQEIDNSK